MLTAPGSNLCQVTFPSPILLVVMLPAKRHEEVPRSHCYGDTIGPRCRWPNVGIVESNAYEPGYVHPQRIPVLDREVLSKIQQNLVIVLELNRTTEKRSKRWVVLHSSQRTPKRWKIKGEIKKTKKGPKMTLMTVEALKPYPCKMDMSMLGQKTLATFHEISWWGPDGGRLNNASKLLFYSQTPRSKKIIKNLQPAALPLSLCIQCIQWVFPPKKLWPPLLGFPRIDGLIGQPG